ncbi:hypothetical protein [Streptomyces sp. NPDC047130]|uniref:hypothetical protein n=1 Tax=Streptomyces sp. NPDC047130 TaxID=3155261 RepID=UPI0033CE9227
MRTCLDLLDGRTGSSITTWSTGRISHHSRKEHTVPTFVQVPRLGRAALATVTAGALAAAGPLVAAPSAHASGVDITCLIGTSQATYDPPLSNTTQTLDIGVTETYGCASLNTSVSSGSTAYSATSEADCLLTANSYPGATRTYHWNDGRSSTITFTVSNAVRAVDGTTTVTSVGTVTAGLGVGGTATRVVVQPQLDLSACATTGVSSTTGTATLAVLPV